MKCECKKKTTKNGVDKRTTQMKLGVDAGTEPLPAMSTLLNTRKLKRKK